MTEKETIEYWNKMIEKQLLKTDVINYKFTK